MVRALVGLTTQTSQVQLLIVPLSVNMCVTVTKQYELILAKRVVMHCSWENNGRPDSESWQPLPGVRD